jgi:hypothetical protein
MSFSFSDDPAGRDALTDTFIFSGASLQRISRPGIFVANCIPRGCGVLNAPAGKPGFSARAAFPRDCKLLQEVLVRHAEA